MRDLENKIVIVAGGRGLIGREIVKQFKERNSIVIDADLSNETSTENNTFKLDLADNSSIDALVSFVMNKYGRIDGLVNAAYPRTQDWGKYYFEESPFSHWENNINLQLNSVFYLNQQILKVMKGNMISAVFTFVMVTIIVASIVFSCLRSYRKRE
jgi:NAD(P)-dependent dehydrogenase (short-subunit alcohol dehydrogenase family)